MADVKQTSPSQPVPKKGMSTGAKVGIGIGIGCCVIILIALVIGLILAWNASNTLKRQQTYKTQLLAINNDTATAYNELNGIHDKYPNLTSADFGTVDKDTGIMENAYDRLLKLDPPSDYKEINEMYKKGLLDLKEAMPIYRQAVRTKNNSDLQRAVDQINKGIEELKQAKAKIDEKNK